MLRVLVFTMLCTVLAASPGRTEELELLRSTLWVESEDGRHRFDVELADTPETKARGLMFRKEMAPDAGMIFDFQVSMPVTMWMKNTFIPLDMLFVDDAGVIRNIAHRTTPLSLDHINSGGPVRVVVELNAGTAQRLGIAIGDRVVHDLFPPPSAPSGGGG